MKEKYLPIGTVVTLKNATKKLMIMGYVPMDNQNKQMYDYSACTYPEGLMDSNKVLLFNHDQIATINFMGLEGDEQKRFNDTINAMLNNMKNLRDVKFPVNNISNTIDSLDIK